MRGHQAAGENLARAAGHAVARVVALIVGVALMVLGLAMGVSLVLLPVGVPVGIAGLLMFLWGVYPPLPREAPAEPPGRQRPA